MGDTSTEFRPENLMTDCSPNHRTHRNQGENEVTRIEISKAKPIQTDQNGRPKQREAKSKKKTTCGGCASRKRNTFKKPRPRGEHDSRRGDATNTGTKGLGHGKEVSRASVKNEKIQRLTVDKQNVDSHPNAR